MPDNKEKLILEAYRLSQERLQCQQALALAADARAINFCVAMFAIAALLTGLSDGSSYQWGLLASAGCCIVAGVVSGFSAAPVEFGAPGSRFSAFDEDFEQNTDYLSVIEELGSHNDEAIDGNDEVMSWNRDKMYVAYFLCVFSPLVGVTVHFLKAMASS